MSHWNRDDSLDDSLESKEHAFDARRWMRGVADRSQTPFIRGLMGDLRFLELGATGFFLDLDDDDFSDVDDMDLF